MTKPVGGEMKPEPACVLKLGIGQLCSYPETAANLSMLEKALAHLAEQGADLAVFPEYCLCLDTLERQGASARSGLEWQEILGGLCQKRGLATVFGGVSVHDADGGVRNSALAFGADGEMLARYDKAHLFTWAASGGPLSVDERQIFVPGDSAPVVFTRSGWKVALTLCYDLRFPQHWLAAVPAPDLYLCPAAFTDSTGRAHWQPLLQARAIENLAFTAGIGQAGQNRGTGLSLHGHSCLFSPWGERLLCLRRGQSSCQTVCLDPMLLHQARAALPGAWSERIGALALAGSDVARKRSSC